MPEALQGAVSSEIGLNDPSYHVERVGEKCRGANPGQKFEAAWSEGGLAIEAGKLNWGLRLEAWGYGEDLAPAGGAIPQANGNRLEYRRDGLTEWYVNGPLGIEQGFTVSSPRKGNSSGEALTLSLAWSGEARVQVEQNEAVVSNLAGEPVLRYSGLSAHDASGRGLRAWFERSGAAILLRVDDREAIYPLVIDPFIQQQKLTASDGAVDDFFGTSVSLSSDGGTALIGASWWWSGAPGQGAAYVFVNSGGTWSQQQKLTASDGAVGDTFGGSVSLSADGGVALIGASWATVGGNAYQGAAYVFVVSGGTWSQQQKLTASDGAVDDDFGCWVSLSSDGGTALIGADGDLSDNTLQGAAYVFANSGGTWSQQQKLTASDGAAGDAFGGSVSLSSHGNTALIGAYRATVGSNGEQGAAYVFVNSGGTWSQQQKLTASDGAYFDQFGNPVSLSSDGGTALIGAVNATIGGNQFEGAAYVFANSGGTWSQQQKLTASDGVAHLDFAMSVSLSSDGGTALIGTDRTPVGDNEYVGAAYVFVNSGGTWSQQQKLMASDGAAGAGFGGSVSLSSDGNTALIGASGVYVTSQGAAYVFGTGSVGTYSISGTVTNGGSGLAGVTMNLTGAATQSTTTDNSGNYSFSGLSKGVYKITPSLAGYIFAPPNITVNVAGVNVTGKSFSANQSVNGACGPANEQNYLTTPTSDLCSAGKASKVTEGKGSWTWTCKGSHSGATASCSANVEANGACGSANKKDYLTQPPTAKLCAAGTAAGITVNGPWTWTCSGSNGGAPANCSANLEVIGACGPANKSSYYAQPSSSDLCTGGTASKVTGKGPWNWSCAGSNGGSTAKCSAELEVNGACGSANGEDLLKAPTSNLCSAGKASKVTGKGPWDWTCAGSNGGTAETCSANLK
jgi:hypothetical protein